MTVIVDGCCEVWWRFFFSFQKDGKKTVELLSHRTNSIRSDFPGNKSILDNYDFLCINISTSHRQSRLALCTDLCFVLIWVALCH